MDVFRDILAPFRISGPNTNVEADNLTIDLDLQAPLRILTDAIKTTTSANLQSGKAPDGTMLKSLKASTIKRRRYAGSGGYIRGYATGRLANGLSVVPEGRGWNIVFPQDREHAIVSVLAGLPLWSDSGMEQPLVKSAMKTLADGIIRVG